MLLVSVSTLKAKGEIVVDDKDVFRRAEKMIDQGELEQASVLLAPYLKVGDSRALYLCALFSVDSNLSEDDFERRRILMLQESAKENFPPAIFELAIAYELGDGVPQRIDMAEELYRRAAELNHIPACFYHGKNVFFGTYLIPGNKIDGLKLIEHAAKNGYSRAIEFLRHLEMEMWGQV